VIFGAGGNIVIHDGWMGLVLVDTGSMGMSDKVLSAIKVLRAHFPDWTEKRIRFIINTGADPEHVGGNEAISKAGVNLLPPNVNNIFGDSPYAEIMANENVHKRMSQPNGRQGAYPTDALPTQSVTGLRNRSVYLNGDGVQMIYQPAAHSDADVFVFFHRADVIATGDILDLRHFPIIDVDHGGTINGEIGALTRLIELSVPPAPFVWHQDRTLIVPGHGRLCDQGDVVEYRDMLVIIRDRVQDLIKKGYSLEQVKKADPTKGYDHQYGSDPSWNSEMFIAAVYKTLMNAKAAN
jgi:glyoxylase-like metal-dependent hydrolase (beta-lactamase superfamily II)